jgi:hypothetical protein
MGGVAGLLRRKKLLVLNLLRDGLRSLSLFLNPRRLLLK